MSQKAKNLAALFHHGISVPRGFCLDETHYREAVQPFESQISARLPDRDSISALFAEIPIPERTIQRVEDGLRLIGDPILLAVRSSGAVVSGGQSIAEDSATRSLAGQFESFLQVPRERVFDAVRGCWASLFNRRSIASFHPDAAYVRDSSMSVVIQEMLPAVASAVLMTVDPLGDGDVGGIELTLGPCEAIVSGISSPDEVAFSRSGGAILRTAVGHKEYRIEYSPFQDATSTGRQLPVDAEDQAAFCVPIATISELIRIGCRIESLFGSPQDIELVITPTGQIVITQTRAITSLPAVSTPFNLALAS